MAKREEEWRENLRTFVRRELRSGFVPRDEIVENALECFDEADPDALQRAAEQMVAREAALLQEEGKSWPSPTDNQRLDEAFEALLSEGIVARQHWTCCQTCGHAEIWGEIEAEKERGVDVRGYTFFHQQDTESAVEGGGLYLAYGALEQDDLVAVGEQIRSALQGRGLQVSWNGSTSARILVQMEWHRAL